MLTRRGFGALAAGSVAAACSPRAGAGEGRTFTAAEVHPVDHPVTQAVEWMNQELARQTDGRLSIRN